MKHHLCKPLGPAAIAWLWLAGCNPDDPNQLGNSTGTGNNCVSDGAGPGNGGGGDGGAGGSGEGGGGAPVESILDQRVLDYNEALRTASLKLVGELPTLGEMESVRTAADQEARYTELIDAMMGDVRFKRRMIDFWKNEFRVGGSATLDSGPLFAARIVVEGRPYTDLFTATSNTCPTFDGQNFVDGDCTNASPTAGILTNPGILAHYEGNLAFRRVRFFQETFACRKQPAEYSATPVPMGAGDYTAPWEFDSIAGLANGGRIDFLDTSSAICANCHATANHRAPLWATFDANGQQQPDIAVNIPVTGLPVAVMGDWLPPGETTGYRFDQPAANLSEMGVAMAQDEEVLSCAVARVWNFAMSRGDIVNDAADVPTVTIEELVAAFKASNGNLRATMRSVFLHPDFVRF